MRISCHGQMLDDATLPGVAGRIARGLNRLSAFFQAQATIAAELALDVVLPEAAAPAQSYVEDDDPPAVSGLLTSQPKPPMSARSSRVAEAMPATANNAHARYAEPTRARRYGLPSLVFEAFTPVQRAEEPTP